MTLIETNSRPSTSVHFRPGPPGPPRPPLHPAGNRTLPDITGHYRTCGAPSGRARRGDQPARSGHRPPRSPDRGRNRQRRDSPPLVPSVSPPFSSVSLRVNGAGTPGPPRPLHPAGNRTLPDMQRPLGPGPQGTPTGQIRPRRASPCLAVEPGTPKRSHRARRNPPSAIRHRPGPARSGHPEPGTRLRPHAAIRNPDRLGRRCRTRR